MPRDAYSSIAINMSRLIFFLRRQPIQFGRRFVVVNCRPERGVEWWQTSAESR